VYECVCLTLTSISPPEVSRSYTIVGVSILPHINTGQDCFWLPKPLHPDSCQLSSLSLLLKSPQKSRPCLLWLRAGSPLIEQARGGLYPRCCARLWPGMRRNNKDRGIIIKSMMWRRQTSSPPKNNSSEELAAAKNRRFSPGERAT